MASGLRTNRKTTPASSPNPSNAKKDSVKNKDHIQLQVNPIKCKVCDTVCLDAAYFESDEDDSVSCDVCNLWVHKKCSNTSTAEWQALKGSNENIRYQCNDCLTNKGQNSNQMQIFQQILRENNDILLKRIASIETNILHKVDEKIERKMTEFEHKNEKMIDDKIKAQLDTFKQNKNEQISIENSIQEQVSQKLDEFKDIEDRKNNLMIFNIKESSKNEIAEETKEDLQAVIQVIKHTNPELTESITKIISEDNIKRLGRKKETSTEDNASKPRPIKLTLPNEATKFKILRKSHKLKSYQGNNKIGLKLDLTKQQQIEERNIRQELISRRENKEDVMIFRGKVIKREDHERLKKEQK